MSAKNINNTFCSFCTVDICEHTLKYVNDLKAKIDKLEKLKDAITEELRAGNIIGNGRFIKEALKDLE